MEIILLEDVINLGYKGDVVNVKTVMDATILFHKKAVIASRSAKKYWLKTKNNELISWKPSKMKLWCGEKITEVGSLTIECKTSSTGKIWCSWSHQIARSTSKKLALL